MTILRKHLQRLRGRTAFITGGKRIGQTVARILAEQGVNIVVSFRHSKKEAAVTVAACRRLGVEAMAVEAEVSSQESVRAAIGRIQARFGRIDILVNMASVYRPVAVEKITADDWDKNIGAHVLGAFWPAQLAVPLMPPGSHIINIADACVVGKMRKRNLPYQVTKAAVAAMTRAMAVEYGERGIFVNAIAPGPILPPEDFPPETWKAIRRSSPVKYPMSDAEAVSQFALLVLYLSLVTMASGHTYPLDQGQDL
ncbi:MAG: SDR family oxidoreductase [Acidobacteriota bacterium]